MDPAPTDGSRLIIHGAPASQPSRAVYWTCMIKRLPFELRPLGLGDMGPDSPLLRLNPTGQVPIIEDGDFAVFEMPAILIYLCEKHGWDDLLPKDLHARTRVHQYLHHHHGFTRRVTMELMAPHVTVAFAERMKGTPIEPLIGDPQKLAKGRAVATRVAELIEKGFFPDEATHLCGPHATIADIACYEELAQLRWADLFDFEGFPTIQRWLREMEQLPFHEHAHRYNLVLGDVRTQANTMERFVEASVAGITALADVA
ncbi:MAG: glutathione S-transferase family protein [Myxococcota bacterium]